MAKKIAFTIRVRRGLGYIMGVAQGSHVKASNPENFEELLPLPITAENYKQHGFTADEWSDYQLALNWIRQVVDK